MGDRKGLREPVMQPWTPRLSDPTGEDPDRPRLKIVHYLSEVNLAHGGVVRAVLDLCAALARAGHTVHLLTFQDTDVPAEWKRGGPGIPKCVTLDWPEGPKPIRRLRKADLLRVEGVLAGAHALHLHVPWEATNPQLAAIAGRRGVPYIISIHGMLDDWTIAQGRRWLKRAYLAFSGRALLQGAACVHCTAEAERDQATKWFSNPRTDVLPLLFDLEPFRNAIDQEEASRLLRTVPGEGPLVLFLSRLHPKKGIEHLLDAAADLWKQGESFRLALAGGSDHHAPEYDRALLARAERLGIRGRAAFVGMVGGTEKLALMKSARVLVLPTSQENWGFVPLESLAIGRPVITTRGVDIWPELERSGGAMIVDQSAGAIAEAARRLIADESLADEMGAKGREWVMRELEPSAVLRRYEALYASLG